MPILLNDGRALRMKQVPHEERGQLWIIPLQEDPEVPKDHSEEQEREPQPRIRGLRPRLQPVLILK